MFIMKQPMSVQSRDIQQLLGKLSKFVCNWRGKVFRAAAARGEGETAKDFLYPTGYRTPCAVVSPFCNTVSPGGGGGPKHFPASITNKLWEFS
jgi:hypothetical protein